MRRPDLPALFRELKEDVPDSELLGRFTSCRCNDAFAELVSRYGRLVWGRCRGLLADADAGDAFQATFLVLSQAAGRIKPGTPLGPWLYGVAYRVCRNVLRANAARHRRRERAAARSESGRPVADGAWDAAFAALAEEVERLPARERTAFVLCCLEGRTQADAAAALGWKPGTLSGRLARAKTILAVRLDVRGITATVASAVALTPAAAPAAALARAAGLSHSGAMISRTVLQITQGLLGMGTYHLKATATAVLLAVGISGWAGWTASAQPPVKQDPTVPTTLPQAFPVANGQADAEEFLFTVEFETPITPKARLTERVTVGTPFSAKAPRPGGGFNAIAGLVRPFRAGRYEVVLTVVDYESDAENTLETTVLDLEPGKPSSWGTGAVVSRFTATLLRGQAGMRGTWIPTAVEADGKPSTPKQLAELQVIVTDDHWEYVYLDRLAEPRRVYRLELDPSAAPKRLTLRDSAAVKPRDVLGIYEFDGDTLRVCFAEGEGRDDPARRPTDFTAKAGSGRVSLTLRRAVPHPAAMPAETVNAQPSLAKALGVAVADAEWEHPKDLVPAGFPELKYVSGPEDRGLAPKAAWRKPITLSHAASGVSVLVNVYRLRMPQPEPPAKPGTPAAPQSEPAYRYEAVEFHRVPAAVAATGDSAAFAFVDDGLLFKVVASGGTDAERRASLARAVAQAIRAHRHPK